MKTPKEQITELMMGKTIEEIERNNTIVEQAFLIKKLERELAEARELVEMQKETMRQMREQYGLGERNVMRELRKQRDMLVEALEQFVNVCDYAPPVDIIKHIGESCASARKALVAVKGGSHERTIRW